MKTELPASMRIKPTHEDVVRGTCNSPTKCMYAMALRRMFPRATYISVNTNCITITLDGIYYHYMLPKKAIKNILLYDDKQEIDLDKSQVTIELRGSKPSAYESTPEVREKHRIKTARRRASPGYIRPETRQTLRGMLTNARLVRHEGKGP